jgi:hypothetical protein
MARPEAEQLFTQPVRQIVLMLIVTTTVAVGLVVTFPALRDVFLAKPALNAFVGAVFLFGILTCFWNILQLARSVSWIEDFVRHRPGHEFVAAPRLLAPLAALLRSRGARMQISASSNRSILDSVATRIDEQRDITRYLGNLLIFLGLLGTFYGLATTVPEMVETIRSLAPEEGETRAEVFDKLMTGLEGQLGGMGTAFSSSLLGLGGSLVVGLLELFVSHGTNRFYRELEEWLSTITRVGLAAGEGEGAAGAEAAALTGALDTMIEQIETLQVLHAEAETSRVATDDRLGRLAEAVTRLTERLEADSGQVTHLARIAEGQERMIAALTAPDAGPKADAESRMRLRSIDVQLLRIFEEMAAGRQESVTELRTDLAALTQAIRALARSPGRG